jgi:hypothetical protein
MCLLGSGGCGGDSVNSFETIVASDRGEHKQWWFLGLADSSGCGEKEIRSALTAAGTSATAVELVSHP